MSERKGTRALELWCKRLVRDSPDVQIDNMTTSWRNGIAFCALVHHFRPDLIDMSKLKPENIYENNQLAFSIAEKHLGIPALLDPEDMVENDVPDRLSILTYLSQFYQRLGHKVNTKSSESEQKTPSKTTPEPTQSNASIKFGKTGLDKCTACGLPVYLAQRLMVSQKLYHRRCFRCSKCSGHLNPKNYHIIDGSDFSCDSCKNEKTILKYLNNNQHDQMGMLAYGDNTTEADAKYAPHEETTISPKHKATPQSILEKINMFEKNIEKDNNIQSKISNLSIKDDSDDINKELCTPSELESTPTSDLNHSKFDSDNLSPGNSTEKVYKSNLDKFNFMQTQLSSDIVDIKDDKVVIETKNNTEDCPKNDIPHADTNINNSEETNPKLSFECELKEESNITDDNRIAKNPSIAKNIDIALNSERLTKIEPEISISVPPRRKKNLSSAKVLASANTKASVEIAAPKTYPDNLNPFSDDEDEVGESQEPRKKISTNPFGSSDEEDDDVPPIIPPKPMLNETITPVKRLIAVNPFWSDGEEPTSDEEDTHDRSSSTYSSMAASTPNLQSTPRRRKAPAPPPPSLVVSAPRHHATSMDDVASISSFSSYNSTINSDQKFSDRGTPLMRKKRPAPTPLDSLSTLSGGGGSLEKGVDSSGRSDGSRKKGPAPGLPLPERREVKLQLSPEELQVQLDLLETQQLGLERQGVLIEKMIRDKCDEAASVPQEEVEDLVIQLCELVNEKNDLFRKQTELMYIRRQQRLEQEQADIEHEIRILQSRPAVNRIDADKVREEQLVCRLVEIVRLRDELVQQLDGERRRERQEDIAIAASIASKRAQRNSDSSIPTQSTEVVALPKKNKVKDKVKKQLKKAKHSLISKKKDESDRKDEKVDKGKKPK